MTADRRQAGLGEAREHVAGKAGAGADEGRDAVPGAEIDVAVEEEDRRGEVALRRLVGHAGNAGAGIEVDAIVDLEALREAVFARDVGAQPAVELIADADAGKRARAEILAEEHRRRLIGARELAVVVGADADVAAQVPAAELDRRRRIMDRGGGGRRSAASADADETAAKTPARASDFMLPMTGSLRFSRGRRASRMMPTEGIVSNRR